MDEVATVNVAISSAALQSVGKQWWHTVMTHFADVTEAHSLQRAVENMTVDILSHLHTH